ncbi:MAG: sensor histidine kinase [Hydrogenophaga sp.]
MHPERPESSLRRRMVAACILLAAVVGGVFAAATYVLIESVEHELIDRRLSRAMAPLLAGRHDGSVVLPPLDLQFVAGPQLPPTLRALEPGTHETEIEGRALHVLIADDGGERFALIDDQSDFERIESVAYGVLAFAFLAGLALALGMGRALANRVLAPLTALVNVVQQGRLGGQAALLEAPDEIGTLARAFDVRSTELGDALNRERLFTADVSHELRTPLAAMLGAAELLAARLDEQEDLRTVAERIRRNAADMAARVGALLQLARAPQTPAPAPVDLRVIAQREFERCAAYLGSKPVQAHLDAPDPVRARVVPELAAVAIDNLLRNACHFTTHGRVTLRVTEQAIQVEDTGPGVPSGVRDRLASAPPGAPCELQSDSGLGLSIVRRAAERLGWSLQLEEMPSGGSCFTLRLGATACSAT